MRSLHRIGVGVDFSEESDRAVVHAEAVAAHLDAELALIHIVSPSASGTYIDENLTVATTDAPALMEARLGRLADRIARPTRTVVRQGKPVEGLEAATEELELGVLVIGTLGRTGIRRFLLGSVAERITRVARSAVLVARGQPPTTRGYRRILVPTDFSAYAEAALVMALTVAAPGARIELFHCWTVPYPEATTLDAAAAAHAAARLEASGEIQRQGEALCKRYAERPVQLEFTARERPTTQAIGELLDTGLYELAVLGSHGRTGLRRWFLGSVAEVTVRHAPCSVMVVKNDLAHAG